MTTKIKFKLILPVLYQYFHLAVLDCKGVK